MTEKSRQELIDEVQKVISNTVKNIDLTDKQKEKLHKLEMFLNDLKNKK